MLLLMISGGAILMVEWALTLYARDCNTRGHIHRARIALIVGVIGSMAGSLFGKVTPRYDADLQNCSLYWHFMGFTVVVCVLVMAIYPRWL